ncbi:hypothetical protein CAPTEDRAFT_189241 [Capitella teleta]|uniref:Uncharacterized protein n=1 Tax=Capitella teleta TaxID=283909 RepID=R7UK95_CAPTE|nr:hypothetical protein CAPTEDRAFT_189241 [Capitella teleta]|eukprot:ELU06605.1 hypothetical protein CAPTEDRAFT_189241 [Capitella teleta]
MSEIDASNPPMDDAPNLALENASIQTSTSSKSSNAANDVDGALSPKERAKSKSEKRAKWKGGWFAVANRIRSPAHLDWTTRRMFAILVCKHLENRVSSLAHAEDQSEHSADDASRLMLLPRAFIVEALSNESSPPALQLEASSIAEVLASANHECSTCNIDYADQPQQIVRKPADPEEPPAKTHQPIAHTPRPREPMQQQSPALTREQTAMLNAENSVAPNGRRGANGRDIMHSFIPKEGVDDVHGGDSLPLGVLSVGDGITDDILKEDLQNTSGLLVDQTRDTLQTTSASQTTDGGLGDALDVVTQHLPVTLGATLSESLTSLLLPDMMSQFLLRVNRIQNEGKSWSFFGIPALLETVDFRPTCLRYTLTLYVKRSL